MSEADQDSGAAVFFAVVFFAVAFFAVAFFDVVSWAVADVAAVFSAAVVPVAAEVFGAVPFFAVVGDTDVGDSEVGADAADAADAAFFAADALAGAAFLPAAAVVGVAFFAADALVGAAFLPAAAFVAALVVLGDADVLADFFAADVLAVDFDAVVPAVLAAVLVAVFAAGAPVAAVDVAGVALTGGADGAFLPASVGRDSFGSFLTPETTLRRSAPALNLGTNVFFVLICSPVRGLRTTRAGRTRFSNEPKPVMATFSPRATSRVMVSSTASSACAAAFLLPSKRAASASMS